MYKVQPMDKSLSGGGRAIPAPHAWRPSRESLLLNVEDPPCQGEIHPLRPEFRPLHAELVARKTLASTNEMKSVNAATQAGRSGGRSRMLL